MKFSLNFVQLIGIDLGSDYIRIWSSKKDEIVIEPACLAVELDTKKVIAVGKEAKAMVGRVGKRIKILFPIRRGVIDDFDSAKVLLKILLDRHVGRTFFSPSVMVSVPASSTSAMEEIVIDLFRSLGMGDVFVIAQPLAAIIGAGVPIADASGAFILQMGSDIVEGAVISLGSVVAHASVDTAGRLADRKIVGVIRSQHRVLISKVDAQRLKHSVGSVVNFENNHKYAVTGKDITRSAPQELLVDSTMISGPLVDLANKYEVLLKKLLYQVPPELTVDVIDKGLLLSGGWSQLLGWEEFFIKKIGVPVSVVEDPELVVIKGISTVLQHLDLFKSSLGYQR